VAGLDELFARNRAWAAAMVAARPGFFAELARRQSPEYLWIGCSDSRVPASQILDLPPGDVFVHRNVANVVVHTGLNCLSVLQYAVDVLHVRHVADVAEKHEDELGELTGERRLARLCELNVAEQVASLCRTKIVEDAWGRGDDLAVHGVVYGLEDGLLRDLGLSRSKGARDGR